MPTIRREAFDKAHGTAGVSVSDLNQKDVAIFQDRYSQGLYNDKQQFTNGSGSYSSTVVQSNSQATKTTPTPSAVANNPYNQAQAIASNSGEGVTSIVGVPSRNNQYNMLDENGNTPYSERWTPEFIKTIEGQGIQKDYSRVSRAYSNAGEALRNRAIRNGVALREKRKENKRQQAMDRVMFGGNEGNISNSGLLALHAEFGNAGIDALVASNNIGLSDLKLKLDQSLMTMEEGVDNKAITATRKYITDQQSKLSQRLVNSAQGGYIVNMTDDSIIAMATDAGEDPFQFLNIKTAIVNSLQEADEEKRKAIVQREITKIYADKSPDGYDVSRSLTGGSVDINGNFNAGTARNRPNGTQCGGYVNDALGLKSAGRGLGDSYDNKMTNAKSDVPIKMGYFVEYNGYKDPSTGIEYGHTGVVETVSADGNTIRIHDYNHNNKGEERIDTWKKISGPDKGGFTYWKDSKGKTHSLGGFGRGNLEIKKTEGKTTQTEVTTTNYELVASSVSEDSNPIDIKEYGNYTTILKNNTGYSNDEIIQITQDASNYGGMQNAMLLNFFNKNNLKFSQQMVNADPDTKIKQAIQIAQLYGSGIPASELTALGEIGVIDKNRALQLANAKELEIIQKNNQLLLEQMNNQAKLDISKASINQKELDSQRDYEIQTNKNLISSSISSKVDSKNVDYFQRETKALEVAQSSISRLFADNIDLSKTVTQEDIDAVSTSIGGAKGLSIEEVKNYINGLYTEESNDKAMYEFYLASGRDWDTVPVNHLERLVSNSSTSNAEISKAFNNILSDLSDRVGYNLLEIKKKIDNGENVTSDELNAYNRSLTAEKKEQQIIGTNSEDVGGGFFSNPSPSQEKGATIGL